MNFIYILALFIPIMPGVPALPSTSAHSRKRKQDLIPKPLKPTKLMKNRSQTRAVGNSAQVFETIDLLSQQSENVNIIQDITFKPNNTFPSESNVQQGQCVAITTHEFSDNPESFVTLSQGVINTIFEDQETDNAIEAFMATLDKSEKDRLTSPGIFEESEDTYKTDTICFIDEKIALLKTKIEIAKKDVDELRTEKNSLYKKLKETNLKLKTVENKTLNFEENLKKFESFREVL